MKHIGARDVRGFSIYEHNVNGSRTIVLNKTRVDYEKMRGTDLQGNIVVYKTDQNGFTEPSEIYDDPDKKIFFCGDSTIECSYVNQENRIPYLCGRLIEEDICSRGG